MRPVLPPRRAAQLGRVGRHLRALAWLRARLLEVLHLSAQVRSRRAIRDAQAAHFVRLLHRVKRARHFHGDLKDLNPSWLLSIVDLTAHALGSDPSRLAAWSSLAEADIKRLKGRDAAVAKLSWHAWVQDQLRKGAGGLHRLAKREQRPSESAVHIDGLLTGSPQAVAQTDREEWKRFGSRWLTDRTRPGEVSASRATHYRSRQMRKYTMRYLTSIPTPR